MDIMEKTKTANSLLTQRSRFYRMLGAIFLVSSLIMGVYGYFVFTPQMFENARSLRQQIDVSKRIVSAYASSDPQYEEETALIKRLERLLKTNVAGVMAYWGFCCLFVLATLVMAWLYMRETLKSYLVEKRSLIRETTQSLQQDNQEN